MNPNPLAPLIEHQLLQADASRRDVEQACAAAIQHGFHSVWVNGSRVIQAAARLEESDVKVATVIGFPLGAMDPDAKRYETEVAVDNGAQEINVVLNAGWLKDGEDVALLRELRDVVEAADERPVGVILETPLLTREERIRAGHLITESGAKLVITSTSLDGAVTVEDVKSWREILGAKFGVTAVGGIEDAQRALALIEAGATRIGTPEGVAILGRLGA